MIQASADSAQITAKKFATTPAACARYGVPGNEFTVMVMANRFIPVKPVRHDLIDNGFLKPFRGSGAVYIHVNLLALPQKQAFTGNPGSLRLKILAKAIITNGSAVVKLSTDADQKDSESIPAKSFVQPIHNRHTFFCFAFNYCRSCIRIGGKIITEINNEQTGTEFGQHHASSYR
jgi:hypothetical protein